MPEYIEFCSLATHRLYRKYTLKAVHCLDYWTGADYMRMGQCPVRTATIDEFIAQQFRWGI